MTLEEFNKLKQSDTFFDYSDYYSIDNIKQNIINEGLSEFSENIIKYINNYGFFEIKRIENKSKDSICFYSNPLFYKNPYWKEFNERVCYIGNVTNSSCGNVPAISWIEQFFMRSNGSFYNQDKKKIADNTADFLDYITTVEYDYHAPIRESTYKRLKEAGWYEGRKIDISILVRECEKNGVYLTELQKHFIEEFGGLEGSREDNDYWFIISNKRIYSEGKPIYFINILDAELFGMNDDKIIQIFEDYGENIIVVGCCGDWSDDILLTENGQMLRYGAYTNGSVDPLGRTAMEGFNVLLGD